MTTKHLSLRLDKRDIEVVESIRAGLAVRTGQVGDVTVADAIRYLLRRGAAAVANDQLAQQTREERP